MLEFVTTEAEDSSDEVRAQRLPFVACELICTWPVYEKLLEDELLLETLLQPLKTESVNLLLLGYLSRILRSLTSSSHSTHLLSLLYASEGYFHHLLRHTYSFSVAELLISLITFGDSYQSEKKEIVLKLVDLAQTAETPVNRYHCTKAVIELLEQAESYKAAKELAAVLVSAPGLERLLSGLQTDRMDVCLYTLQVLKTVTQSQVLRSVLQSDQSSSFDSFFPTLISALDLLLHSALQSKLPAEVISTAFALLRNSVKLDLQPVTEALVSHGTLHACTLVFLANEFPSFVSVQYYLLTETVCALAPLRLHFINSTGIQALILEAVQSPMIS